MDVWDLLDEFGNDVSKLRGKFQCELFGTLKKCLDLFQEVHKAKKAHIVLVFEENQEICSFLKVEAFHFEVFTSPYFPHPVDRTSLRLGLHSSFHLLSTPSNHFVTHTYHMAFCKNKKKRPTFHTFFSICRRLLGGGGLFFSPKTHQIHPTFVQNRAYSLEILATTPQKHYYPFPLISRP